VFVYVTNEEPTAKDIYFDDLKITHTPTIIAQTDSYYPFGLNHGNMSYVREGRGKNQFLYNGKELVEGFELGWYDYGARYYAPDLGRWHAVDPLADKFTGLTPYNYVANSPLKLIDPDGRQIIVNYTEQKRDNDGNLMYNKNGKPRMISKEAILSVSKEGCIVAKDNKGNNIDNDFVKNVVGSLNHVKDFEGMDLIESVINDTDNIAWIEETSPGVSAEYYPLYQTVYWNSETGIKIEDNNGDSTGEKQSPALSLYHEIGHVYNHFTDKKGFDNRLNEDVEHYDNEEEKFVIMLYVNPVAEKMNNGTRNNHYGKTFLSKGYDSTDEK
jgi:RHS repeat-associated protein